MLAIVSRNVRPCHNPVCARSQLETLVANCVRLKPNVLGYLDLNRNKPGNLQPGTLPVSLKQLEACLTARYKGSLSDGPMVCTTVQLRAYRCLYTAVLDCAKRTA
eukprot:6205276-Pleurochrysis_carterae.AAC.3